jgi:hypothetical protein
MRTGRLTVNDEVEEMWQKAVSVNVNAICRPEKKNEISEHSITSRQ